MSLQAPTTDEEARDFFVLHVPVAQEGYEVTKRETVGGMTLWHFVTGNGFAWSVSSAGDVQFTALADETK